MLTWEWVQGMLWSGLLETNLRLLILFLVLLQKRKIFCKGSCTALKGVLVGWVFRESH